MEHVILCMHIYVGKCLSYKSWLTHYAHMHNIIHVYVAICMVIGSGFKFNVM